MKFGGGPISVYVTFQRVRDENKVTGDDDDDNDVQYGDLVRISLYKEINRKLALSDESSSSGSA